ncbi:S8 family serine peptidase [Glaciecola siphonariae]|uniref:S8 family serine peptidase n=1 Tax=Glaciecola siphonariae TaxID=521012 RepID=A0ABV9LZV5_9ALTE
MKFNKYLSGIAVSAAVASCFASAAPNIVQVDTSKFSATGPAPVAPAAADMFIIQLKGAPAIAKASEIGQLIPSNQLVARFGNNYNAKSPEIQAYVAAVKEKQAAVASEIGVENVFYNYAHTFNGFSARLNSEQLAALQNHPDVAAVYQDELHTLTTSNTPAFLGLTGPDGQHTLGIKGEDVIVGILDSGIWPENMSFGEDPSVEELAYGPAPEGWAGECNVGSVGQFVDDAGNVVYNDETAPVDEFTCNNKLIGARYFGTSFSSVYEMRFDLGEFASPRDADGHGSHTASTAAGNAGVTAVLSGADVGTVSGIAPRARVAAYKVCWNANYVSPEGVNERGCFFGDSMAAIDQAVVDGVDVLNYSIGNSQAINSPVYNAALRAADAGVFFSGSGGNSGPAAATVSNIAPWVATVAASTYDGESALIGTELEINSGNVGSETLFSLPGQITAPIPAEGLTGDLALAEPLLACDPITNPEALAGKIALIARGACNFSTKILGAQDAGAVGVVVYSDARTPTAMGGDGTGITIPGVMVTNSDGLLLSASVEAETTNVTMTLTPDSGTITEVGNIMAGFSSRGVNTQTNDIIKPDITAPGVRILAASSPEQLNFGGNPQGENFAYLQGTSMSSPHIAGMAALLSGQYPDWTPAQIKSAIMTTARQNVVKEDGETPADPFDFGAGHVDPVPAMNPGLVYNANLGDYLGFLCGQGEAGLVSTLAETTCADLEADGFATDASQLNYPSIAIGTLEEPETITRTVTDVTGDGGVYTVSVEAPTGIAVTVATFDSEGVQTEDGLVTVAPNGTASYALTFERVPGEFVPEQFAFGAVTLEGDNGINVRSPIAVNPAAINTIAVPETLSLSLNRGRGQTFVETLYSGAFTMEYAGLVPAAGIESSAISNPGAFNFGANVPTSTFLRIREGTTLMRFTLVNELVSNPDANVDLLVYRCVAFSCSFVESSTNPDSNEEIILVNPVPNDPADPGALYILFAQGVDTQGADSVDYTVATWITDGVESTTRITASRRAVEGRFQNISIRTRGLNPEALYMGTIEYFDAEGESQGTTVLEVQP